LLADSCAHAFSQQIFSSIFAAIKTINTVAAIEPEQAALHSLSMNKNKGIYNHGLEFDVDNCNVCVSSTATLPECMPSETYCSLLLDLAIVLHPVKGNCISLHG
jgi:hypothetical protein